MNSSQECLLSVEAAARRLGMSPESLERWIAEQRLLAWRDQSGELVVPAEQILGRRTIVNGMEIVAAEIGDPRATWRFLSDESPFFDTNQRPIDALKRGEIARVLQAANSQGDSFT